MIIKINNFTTANLADALQKADVIEGFVSVDHRIDLFTRQIKQILKQSSFKLQSIGHPSGCNYPYIIGYRFLPVKYANIIYQFEIVSGIIIQKTKIVNIIYIERQGR